MTDRQAETLGESVTLISDSENDETGLKSGSIISRLQDTAGIVGH